MSLDAVKAAVAEALEIDPAELQPDVVLADLESYDSISVLTMMVALDDLGVRVPQNELNKLRTYGDIENLARTQLGITG